LNHDWGLLLFFLGIFFVEHTGCIIQNLGVDGAWLLFTGAADLLLGTSGSVLILN